MTDVEFKKLKGRTIESARWWSDSEYLGITIEFTDGNVFELAVKPRPPKADTAFYDPNSERTQKYRRLPVTE